MASQSLMEQGVYFEQEIQPSFYFDQADSF